MAHGCLWYNNITIKIYITLYHYGRNEGGGGVGTCPIPHNQGAQIQAFGVTKRDFQAITQKTIGIISRLNPIKSPKNRAGVKE